MSTIASGTTSGTALVSTGDTTGTLVLQTNGTTTAVTIGTNQVVTLAQPLPVASGGTGATSLSGITTGTATNLAGGSNGTVPYQSAAGTTQMLAVGTSGQVLRSNGAAAPSWVTPSAGALVYLSQVTASSSATVDIETGIGSTYDNYMLVASDVYCGTTNPMQLLAQMKISGTYQTASYQFVIVHATGGTGTVSNTGSASDTAMKIAVEIDSANTSSSLGFTLYFGNVNSANYKTLWGNGGAVRASSNNPRTYSFMGGYFGGTGTLTGIRFSPLSTTITRGTFRLYGIVNS